MSALVLAASRGRERGGREPSHGSQRLGDITAHLGGKKPDQGRDSALHIDLLDHPDTTLGDRFEHVVEDDLAQGQRAFARPVPPDLDRSDREGTAQSAALLGPAGRTWLERTIQPRDLLADIPLRPAVHIGPHRPHRRWLGFKGRLALE
jgi:hypothetical protein